MMFERVGIKGISLHDLPWSLTVHSVMSTSCTHEVETGAQQAAITVIFSSSFGIYTCQYCKSTLWLPECKMSVSQFTWCCISLLQAPGGHVHPCLQCVTKRTSPHLINWQLYHEHSF